MDSVGWVRGVVKAVMFTLTFMESYSHKQRSKEVPTLPWKMRMISKVLGILKFHQYNWTMICSNSRDSYSAAAEKEEPKVVSEWFNQAQFPDCITIFMDSGKTSTTFHQILHGMGLCSSGQQSPSPPHTGVHQAYREMLSVQQTFLSGDTPCRTCLIEHASQIKLLGQRVSRLTWNDWSTSIVLSWFTSCSYCYSCSILPK